MPGGKMQLKISLLGSFSATLEGQNIRAFESDKVRALLAYLAVEADGPHRREALTGLLWPEKPESAARHNLNQALYNLRHVLGRGGQAAAELLTTPEAVQFRPNEATWLDEAEFKRLLEQCERHPHPAHTACVECKARLEQAAALYRGEFLADLSIKDSLAFEEWALVLRERLRLQMLAALEQLVNSLALQGKIGEALVYARRQALLDPFGEAGQRQVMRLLARQGQLQQALAQYALCQHTLQVELGTSPSQETQVLAQRLRAELEGRGPVDHLPVPLTPFIRRTEELAGVMGLLRDPDCRLVTVLGPGGCGKTRLALETAHTLRYDYPNGAHLVPLSTLNSADELLPAIATALKITFQEKADSQAQLLDYLRNKRMLLVLDSFECVLAGAGWLVELLRLAPGVQALVTSRARLNIKTGQVFPLGGMRYPEGNEAREARQYSAVQLFAAGAERTQPGFVLDEAALLDAGRICRLVRGMPLGLLLASAWVEAYPLGEIAVEIERSLDFLSVEWQDVPDRQRSLRATFEYSWRLLKEQEREVLAGLSVFHGSFTRQAAGQVARATVQALRGLVEKSMLQDVSSERYQLHDLLRQYAGEKLAENKDAERKLRQIHSEFYLEKLVQWEADLKGHRQMGALAEMEYEIADSRAACLGAAVQGDWNRMDKAVDGLCEFYGARLRRAEGESACHEILERLGEAIAKTDNAELPVLRAWLLARQAEFSRFLGKIAAGRNLLEEAQASLAQGHGGAGSQRAQALIWFKHGQFEENLEIRLDYYQKSLELFRQVDESWWIAVVLDNIGNTLHRLGHPVESLRAYTGALAIRRVLGDKGGIADSLNSLSYFHASHGYFEQALVEMQEAVDIGHLFSDRIGTAGGYLSLGVMLGWNGRFAESIEMIERSLPVIQEYGARFRLAWGTMVLSLGKLLTVNFPDAIRLGNEARELCRADRYDREEAASLIAIGCGNLGQGDYAHGLEQLEESAALYQKMHYRDELGWALGGLSLANHFLGHPQQARQKLCEALRIVLEVKGIYTLVSALPATALLLVEGEQVEKAVEVCALVRRKLCVYNNPWFEEIAGQKVDERLAEMPPQTREQAEQRGRECDTYVMVAELLVALGCTG